jgi:uncharacterized protein
MSVWSRSAAVLAACDRRLAGGLAAALAISAVFPAAAQTLPERVNKGLVEVITGRSDGAAARMANDLADVLDDGATRRVLPVIGKGGLQNITDLKALRGIDLAIVQQDVLADAKDRRLIPAIETLSYVAKLYNAEFHLLAGEPIRRIQDLAGKKVNFDVAGGGTAVTGTAVFRALDIAVEATAFDQPTALEKLKTGEIAAMAYVVAKPAPLFLDRRLPPGLHLLAIPRAPALLETYLPTRLTADDYPDLVPSQAPVDTLAVGTVLAAANLAPNTERYRNVAHFVDAFFTHFAKLQEAPRHPKWQEVNLAADLPGWRRFGPAETWLKQNSGGPAMADAEMKEVFGRFLSERSRIAGNSLSEDRKDELFRQFQRWEASQKR